MPLKLPKKEQSPKQSVYKSIYATLGKTSHFVSYMLASKFFVEYSMNIM